MLNISEMQIKAAVRYCVIPSRMVKIKRQATASVGEDVEKVEPLCTVRGGEVKGGSPREDSSAGPWDVSISIRSAFLLLDIHQRGLEPTSTQKLVRECS